MGEAKRRRTQGLGPRAPKLDLAGQRAVAGSLVLYSEASPDFIDVARTTFAAEWATAQEILGEQGRSPAAVLEVAGNAQAWAAHLAAQEAARAPESVGCREGCAWCCFIPVTATASEVLLLAAWILREYSPERLAALRDRLRDAAPIAEQPIATRRLLACPVLEDNRCGAYAARPGACVGYTAPDPTPCRDFVESDGHCDTPFRQNMLIRMTNQVPVIASEALHAAGWPASEPLELVIALQIALAHPNPLAAWMAGEPIFAPAQRRPEDTEEQARRLDRARRAMAAQERETREP